MTVLDFLHPALAILVAGAAGTLVDRTLALGLGSRNLITRWTGRVVVSWVLLFLWVMSPITATLVFTALLIVSRRLGLQQQTRDTTSVPLIVLAPIAVLALVVASRGGAMVYWDENLHLGRAALGVSGLEHIRAVSLDPSPVLIQRGYPILWPVVIASLSASSSPSALLVASCAALFILAVFFFGLCVDHFGTSPGFGMVPIAALLMTPLSLVHMRTAYADLPLGLLTAAWVLQLSEGRSLTAIALFGMGIGGFKDEGIAAAASGVLAFCLCGAQPRLSPGRRALTLAGVASVFTPILVWKHLFPNSGIEGAAHTFVAVHWDRIGEIAVQGFFRHAADVDSWGVIWQVIAGTVVSLPWTWKRLGPDARLFATCWTLHVVALMSAIVVGPADVVRHATVLGFVTNRLLIQVLPGTLLFLAAYLRDISRPHELAAPEVRLAVR